jgi:hypothetical protein
VGVLIKAVRKKQADISAINSPGLCFARPPSLRCAERGFFYSPHPLCEAERVDQRSVVGMSKLIPQVHYTAEIDRIAPNPSLHPPVGRESRKPHALCLLMGYHSPEGGNYALSNPYQTKAPPDCSGGVLIKYKERVKTI